MIVVNEIDDSVNYRDTSTSTNESVRPLDGTQVLNATGFLVGNSSFSGFANFAVQEVRGVHFNSSGLESQGSQVIVAANWTTNTNGRILSATATNFSNVTFDYTYTLSDDVEDIVNNASVGTRDFFSNSGTWLSLLAVVIIILIISAVIIVVNGFGGGGRRSGGAGPTL